MLVSIPLDLITNAKSSIDGFQMIAEGSGMTTDIINGFRILSGSLGITGALFGLVFTFFYTSNSEITKL
jgi:hypothetical protein